MPAVFGALLTIFSGGANKEASYTLGFTKNAKKAQYPLPRVPNGQAFWYTVKKRVAKGGGVMRSKLSDYIRLLKKGERGRKSPVTI